MSLCIAVTDWGSLEITTSSIEECTSYVLVSASAYRNSVGNLEIDSALYQTVSGYILLSFVGGHVLGRIIKTLSKG